MMKKKKKKKKKRNNGFGLLLPLVKAKFMRVVVWLNERQKKGTELHKAQYWVSLNEKVCLSSLSISYLVT